jgi:hypothetical protein
MLTDHARALNPVQHGHLLSRQRLRLGQVSDGEDLD